MRAVFLTWKIVEAICSLTCMVIHTVGFNFKAEPFPHMLYYCGIFYGYFLLSLLMVAIVAMGLPTPLIVDLIYSAVGAMSFYVCSLASMGDAEKDHHLMFLTDYEENKHMFFRMNKLQSVVSLFTAIWYVMHTCLVADMLIIVEENPEHHDAAYQPLQLSCPFPICTRSKCCKRLKPNPSEIRRIDRIV